MNSDGRPTERYYFEQFRRVYPIPDGCVVYGDKPDVIIDGRKRIGIEITNFFLQPGDHTESEQRQSRYRAEIIAQAQKLYLAEGGKSIELTFSFDKAHPIGRSRKRAIAKELAAVTRRIDGRQSGGIEKSLFLEVPEVTSVYLNAREYPDAKWRLMQAHSVGLTSKNALETIIRTNETKASEYRQCDAYWLLIVVEAMDAAQEQEARIDDADIASDVFEKIIVFHTFGHIIEVKV